MPPSKMAKTSLYGGLFVLVMGSLVLAAATLIQSPDREIRWNTVARSRHSPSRLDQALRQTVTWPQWFRSIESAKIIDVREMSVPLRDQIIIRGSRIEFTMEWNGIKTRLRAFVLDYVPASLLVLGIAEDPAGRFSLDFGNLIWTIRLTEKSPVLTELQGELRARTRSWKSRLFGRVLPDFFLKEAFLPDLDALAQIKDSSPLLVAPESQQ